VTVAPKLSVSAHGAQVILKSQLTIEAHVSAATAYINGPLTVNIAARTIMACRLLPPTIRGICVDLRSVSVCDLDALAMLYSLFVEWRSERRVDSRVVYPRFTGRDAFVAIPCAIRDAPDAELRPERDDRVVLVPPSLVW
jgi:hypothetical protein